MQRPTNSPSAYTAGEPTLALGIAAIVGFIVVIALTRVLAFPSAASTNAARHPLTVFNAALTGLH